jgi:hypothetical protein
MTIKEERISAVKRAIEFVRKCYLGKRNGGYSKIPKDVKDDALSVSRHLCSKDLFDHYFTHRD